MTASQSFPSLCPVHHGVQGFARDKAEPVLNEVKNLWFASASASPRNRFTPRNDTLFIAFVLV
jgi:hypothetical protein